MLYRRQEEEEEEEPETATMATQTEADEDETESFEMTERHQDTVPPQVFLHPAATRQPWSSRPAADSGPSAQPQRLERLTTEDIADRLHSHGAGGAKNVQPGYAVVYLSTATNQSCTVVYE